MNKLIIIGASGHGKVIADIAIKNGYRDIVFADDNETIKECAGFPVIYNTDEAILQNADKFVAIGNSKTRRKFQEKIKSVTLIHPNATISRRVKIGTGSVVMAGAVINSDVKIGEGCIINTCASVDHDCKLEDYSHISVGAHIAGACNIGENTWIGAGATVSNNINICNDCIIGAGATIVKEIKIKGIYVGTPAKRITK